MRALSRYVLAIALTSTIAQPVLAQSAQCINSSELRAGMRFAMPTVIGAVSKQCKPLLPANAYLITKGQALSQRYAAIDGDDALLSTLIAKVDRKGDFKGLDISMLKPLFVGVIGKELATDIKPNSCPLINKVLEQLDPLPAENMINLIEVVMREYDADAARKAAKNGHPDHKAVMCPTG